MSFEQQRLRLFERNGFAGESHRLTDATGRTTYAIVRGDGPRPTVLIHGGLSEASEWSLLAGRLGGHVVIPDRPGCGLSYPVNYLGVGDYRAAAAGWVDQLLEGLGIERVDLVGNSMGGYFALCYALAHPERVRRLVLVGAPAGLHRHLPLFLRLWGNRITGPLIRRMPMRDPEVLRRRAFASFLVAEAEQIPRDFLETAVAAAGLPGANLASYSMLRVVSTLRGWRPSLELREIATRVTTPTLFTWGEVDAFAPPAIGETVIRRMPNARLEVLPGTGHLPHLERPTQVGESIGAFTG